MKSFTTQTKQISSKDDANFKKLFQALKGADEIVILKDVITYLKGNTYNSNIEKLKALIDKS